VWEASLNAGCFNSSTRLTQPIILLPDGTSSIAGSQGKLAQLRECGDWGGAFPTYFPFSGAECARLPVATNGAFGERRWASLARGPTPTPCRWAARPILFQGIMGRPSFAKIADRVPADPVFLCIRNPLVPLNDAFKGLGCR